VTPAATPTTRQAHRSRPPDGAAPELPPLDSLLKQAGRENFPVASRLLPSATRRALFAIYGFARLVDDVGDETSGDVRGALDWIDAEVDRAYGGGDARHPAIERMAAAAREYDIPPEPLHRLVEANRRDQEVTSYGTFDELLEYCALSANPVGQMVLHVFGHATPARVAFSDAICSGLQVTEHLQDVREDLARGRVYLPEDDLARLGATRADLALEPPPERVRAVIALEVERARELLDRGAPLTRTLPGRPGIAVAAFVHGGHAALDAIEAAEYAVAEPPPRPRLRSRMAAALHTGRVLLAR
jgi:squalene synthase HpnC